MARELKDRVKNSNALGPEKGRKKK